mgnify:CR=1 FL=1
MATTLAANATLTPVGGEPRPIEEWVITFHLVVVALDPYTYESSWLIETAGRILTGFRGADCRVAWLVTADEDQTRDYLGPWGDELLAFADPDRTAVEALGLQTLPAIVHVDQGLNIVGAAEGWQPEQWRTVASGLADAMSWSQPLIPAEGDPTPYVGTPALG